MSFELTGKSIFLLKYLIEFQSWTLKVVILFCQLGNILTFRLGELCPKKLPQPVMFKKEEATV